MIIQSRMNMQNRMNIINMQSRIHIMNIQSVMNIMNIMNTGDMLNSGFAVVNNVIINIVLHLVPLYFILRSIVK